MIKPDVLESDLPYGPSSCRGSDIWETTRASCGPASMSVRARHHRRMP
jgi:hypothetical protein